MLKSNADNSETKFFEYSNSELEQIRGRAHVFHCFDQSKIQIMNDVNSSKAFRLSFYFEIPQALCQNEWWENKDLECTPSIEYDRALASKWIVLLHNQQRFDSEVYHNGKHIVRETVSEWIRFPRHQKLMELEIQETVLHREDNKVMNIYGVTQE